MAEPNVPLMINHRPRLCELAEYHRLVSSRSHHRQGVSRSSSVSTADVLLPSLPRLADDVQLTALAQLAAFRTGCQRCFVSLIDDEAQHVIAEATRSVSTYNPDLHEAGDELILGAQSLPLNFSICPTIFGAFLGEPGPFIEQSANHANKDFVIIADLEAESKIKHVPAMKYLAPVLRYYVAVPLRSESGLVLGTICVIDSSPQQPQQNHVVALQEIATLVMRHLENSRSEERHHRAELLLSGLAHFVRGQDSMSASREITSHEPTISPVRTQQARLSVGTLASLPKSPSSRQYLDVTATELSEASASLEMTATIFSEAEEDVFLVSPNTTPGEVLDGFNFVPVDEQTTTQSTQPFLEDVMDVRHTFSRASNLIRQAMDLDAAIFLEVPHNRRFNKQRGKHKRARYPEACSMDQPYRSANYSGSRTASSDSSPSDCALHADKQWEDDAVCLRLGYAIESESSLLDNSVMRPFLSIPAKLLSDLAFHYPQGRIFHFDSYAEETSTSGKHSSARVLEKLSSSLHRSFPEARSLIFLPLYDSDRKQIHAGFIGVSASPTRVLQEHESTYVSAFVNSLMCEVMRLEALKTDKAKSDFLSSISHELRSPLHGILASSQLLAESKILPRQVEFVEMINTCARTLLDTMDHLLDYAKINHFTQRKTQKKGRSDSVGEPQPMSYSRVASTDMLLVVEETVASMAASTNQMLRSTIENEFPSRPDEKLTVPIVLDIAPHESWQFDTEVGSWRRLIMNVVGNSLKYTQYGHIKVEFGLGKHSDTEILAELTIIDTGQGISEEYLKHRLYTPFTQENNLSVGSGLGLSLTHHIVSSLGGDMRITSEVGSGTKIHIKVPLCASKRTQQSQDSTEVSSLATIRQQTFSFVGFDGQPPLSEEPTGMPSVHMKTLSVMKDSLSSLLSSWFKLQPVSRNAAVVVVEESFLENNLEEFDCLGQRLLIVGLKGRRNMTANRVKHARYVRLSPPIGPTRMTAALKSLFEEQNVSDSPVSEIPPHSCVSEPALSNPVMEPVDPPTKKSDHHECQEAILLVDDNDINLRILVACIEKLKLKDVKLLTASDGRKAVEIYTASIENGVRISVVFMDLSMPVLDGFEATRQIRSYENSRGIARNKAAKIMALTGLASADAMKKVKVSGFDSYLRKPTNLKTIREALTAARI